MRQYEIVCANDAERAPRKYPDNLSSVAHQDKIIWQSKIRLKIPSRQHVVDKARKLQRIIEMKKVGFEVTTKCHYHIC